MSSLSIKNTVISILVFQLQTTLTIRAGVVEWLMAPGCKPGGFTPYVGSNPTPCTRPIAECGFIRVGVGFFQSAFRNPRSAIDMRE